MAVQLFSRSFFPSYIHHNSFTTKVVALPSLLSFLAPPYLHLHQHVHFTISTIDIEIRVCCSPPPGRSPFYFSVGCSSPGKSNQPTLMNVAQIQNILLFTPALTSWTLRLRPQVLGVAPSNKEMQETKKDIARGTTDPGY